jgi:hypothetical protein
VVVKTGQSLKVTVEESGGPFQAVYLVCYQPIGVTIPLSAPPYVFSVAIPEKGKIDAGSYLVTAHGYTSPGHGVRSEPIAVQVEPSEELVSLRADPPSLDLEVGEKVGYLSIIGTFAEGVHMYLTASINTKFASTKTSVATVDAHGVVTAIARGTATLVVSHDKAKIEVPIEVTKEGLRIR